ncbi:MAG: hypothetical protein ACOCWA_03600 [Bacteroidota bacterium]
MKKKLHFIILFWALFFIELYGQKYHPWCYRTQDEYGKYMSRTVHKLTNSTVNKPQIVNIIIYGETLSKQNWTIILEDSLSARYPSADVRLINKSIEGFSLENLRKTLNFDIFPEYPDLVIFHANGPAFHYEKIIRMIRSRSSTEMLVWNDPFMGEDQWSDTMSFHLIPRFCEENKVEFANIRTSWSDYLKKHNLSSGSLLNQGNQQLNKKGNELLATLLLGYFKPVDLPDKNPYSLTDTLNLRFQEDVNRMDYYFEGNAVEVIMQDSIPEDQRFRILINGYPPSTFQDGYFHSRPNHDKKINWPWETGTIYHLENHNELEEENWVLKLTSRDDSLNRFTFDLHGSVSGFDGAGTNKMTFVSNSGKIVIQPQDWFIKQAWDRTGIDIQPGYTIEWETYTHANDYITSDFQGKKAWLVQGLRNGKHLLQIISFGNYPVPIKKIIIHKPYLNE